jgi:hypothetical protein
MAPVEGIELDNFPDVLRDVSVARAQVQDMVPQVTVAPITEPSVGAKRVDGAEHQGQDLFHTLVRVLRSPRHLWAKEENIHARPNRKQSRLRIRASLQQSRT